MKNNRNNKIKTEWDRSGNENNYCYSIDSVVLHDSYNKRQKKNVNKTVLLFYSAGNDFVDQGPEFPTNFSINHLLLILSIIIPFSLLLHVIIPFIHFMFTSTGCYLYLNI